MLRRCFVADNAAIQDQPTAGVVAVTKVTEQTDAVRHDAAALSSQPMSDQAEVAEMTEGTNATSIDAGAVLSSQAMVHDAAVSQITEQTDAVRTDAAVSSSQSLPGVVTVAQAESTTAVAAMQFVAPAIGTVSSLQSPESAGDTTDAAFVETVEQSQVLVASTAIEADSAEASTAASSSIDTSPFQPVKAAVARLHQAQEISQESTAEEAAEEAHSPSRSSLSTPESCPRPATADVPLTYESLQVSSVNIASLPGRPNRPSQTDAMAGSEVILEGTGAADKLAQMHAAMRL